MWLDVRQLRVEEPILIIISAAMDEKVFGSHAALLAPRDENNDWFCTRVLRYGKIRWFGHGNHERGEVGNAEALYMDVHVQGSSARVPKIRNRS